VPHLSGTPSFHLNKYETDFLRLINLHSVQIRIFNWGGEIPEISFYIVSNNTYMKQLLAFVCLAAIAVAGCKKNTALNGSALPSNTFGYLMTDPWDSAANTDNPADSAGFIHNIALQYVDSMTTASGSGLRSYDTAITFLRRYWGSAFDTTAFKSEDSYTNVQNQWSLVNAGQYSLVISGMSYSSAVKTKLSALVVTMEDTTHLPASLPYDSIKSKIVAWEHQVDTSTTFTATEKGYLFAHSSIARYSLYYWYGDFQKQWNAMTPAQQNATTKAHKWWQWLIIGVADGLGYAAGATGTAGTPLGGITGAVALSGLANTLVN
jgi:hypothetical protein